MKIERLRLKKLNNTRDLGGLPAADGKKIRRGKLLRSGRLYKLPEKTIESLKKTGLSTIIDLRTEREQEEYPQTIIEGVTYIHLPLFCTATAGITHERSMAGTMLQESKRLKSEFGTADNYMMSMYEIILFNDESKARLRKFFDILLNNDGCILWHCSAGKDRTGICAMLIEAVLGVDEQTIIDDYVASNRFQRRVRLPQRLGLIIAPVPRRFKLFLYSQMKAKPQFISGTMDVLKEKYGSVIDYCKKELNLTDEEITLLRDKFTE